MKKLTLMLLLMAFLPLAAFNQNEGDSKKKRREFPEYPPLFKSGVATVFKADYLKLDYSKFFPYVGDYNDSINEVTGTGQYELGFKHKNHYFGFSYGYNSITYGTDSLDGKFNINQWGFRYGYNMIYSWRLIVRPYVALKWNKSRLINTSADEVIPLQQYIDNRDLDIRFNQPLCFTGVDLAYKIYLGDDLSRYFTVGAFAGYIFKLSHDPIVYTRRTRLDHVPSLGVEHISFGISFSFNADFEKPE